MNKIVDGVEVPLTQAEIDARLLEEAEWKAKMDALALVEYQRLRAAEYPKIGDQLDALWKLMQAQPTVLNSVPESKAVSDEILAVKAKYPEPVKEIK